MHNHRFQKRVAVLQVLRQKVAGQVAAAVGKRIHLYAPAAHLKTFMFDQLTQALLMLRGIAEH